MTLRYSACNDQNCIPPTKETFNLKGTAKIAAAKVADTPAKELVEEPVENGGAAEASAAAVPVDSVADTQAQGAAAENAVTSDTLWEPVDFESTGNDSTDSSSLWYIFITCFLGGFVALLTPCVWPMIPMTVSFFLKKGKSRAKSVGDAVHLRGINHSDISRPRSDYFSPVRGQRPQCIVDQRGM